MSKGAKVTIWLTGDANEAWKELKENVPKFSLSMTVSELLCNLREEHRPHPVQPSPEQKEEDENDAWTLLCG